MEFLAIIYPGLGVACTLILLVLGVGQARIYLKKGFARSRDLAIFCGFNAFFSFNIFISHSRMFSDEFTYFYIVGLQFCMFAAFYFYLRSMSYFIAIPGWLRKFYYTGNIVLGVVSIIPIVVFYATGTDIYFNRFAPLLTDNYFINSYTVRYGTPTTFVIYLLSIGAALNVILSAILLRRILKSSKDYFLVAGLSLTLLTSGAEHFALPFAGGLLYLPLIFFSNVLEALRMCFLTTKETGLLKNHGISDSVEGEKSQNLSLSEARLRRLGEKLEVLLSNSKIYQNPNLRLEDLAFKIGLPSYQLSQVIRFGLATNFHELINSYRIREAQERLADRQRLQENILDIAYQSGFNSKSTFNMAFKKNVGLTPSEYRKSHKKTGQSAP